MKTLLVGINSQYVHSSLALWYIKEYCGKGCGEIKILEHTINDRKDLVLSSIFLEKPDVAAFSCYIWNIDYILKLSSNLKKVLPGLKIVLGGPEVSHDGKELMEENPFVDYVISGEGELPFKMLLSRLSGGEVPEESIPGLCYRRDGRVCSNGLYHGIEDLDLLPSPYTDEMLTAIGDRIVYFESSRGCPFCCSYCLSSTSRGVRYFSMERVKGDLNRLIKRGVKLVKFVDRTFNLQKERTMEILGYIMSLAPDTRFHFEAVAELFDDKMLNLISKAPPGLIQFEIGIQTTSPASLEAVGRRTDLEKAFSNIEKLLSMKNTHIHLDLIAGLPGESLSSFEKAFNRVYGLNAHKLQLGFLKLLKGSAIRNEAPLYGYSYTDYPPYEVLSSNSMSYGDLLLLKGAEHMLERYYNSKRFSNTLKYLAKQLYPSALDFFIRLYGYYRKIGAWERRISYREAGDILLEFILPSLGERDALAVNELLKFDFLLSDSTGSLPPKLKRKEIPDFKERCRAFLLDEVKRKRYLPSYISLTPGELLRKVHFEAFDFDVMGWMERGEADFKETVVLFDYGTRHKVTGLYHSCPVEF